MKHKLYAVKRNLSTQQRLVSEERHENRKLEDDLDDAEKEISKLKFLLRKKNGQGPSPKSNR